MHHEGFKKSTGEIMAWLNSDDKYHHHAFFKGRLCIHQKPPCGMDYRPAYEMDRDGNLFRALLEYSPYSHGKCI